MDDTSVVVVGGGFGGLSAACYLADAGAHVTLLEKNDRLGGLASQFTEAGFRFDTGPTWYMMPEVFMPVEWDGHFRDIYEGRRWPTDPTYYVCNAARTDPTVAPEGGSALCVSMAVPAGADDSPEIRRRYREKLLADLATATGVDVREDVVYERDLAVSDFARRYNARGGTLGLSQSLRQTGPFRPPHRSKAVDGLYFTGSSTNPGVGVPICLISGEHAAACVREDFE